MEDQSSAVECGSQAGSDVRSVHHHQRHHQLGANTEQYLDQEPDRLGHEDDYYDDEEVGTDDMRADNISNSCRHTASPADSSMSRKSNKPLMEKKRRQRINRCLNDLKTLVLEGSKKDPSKYSRLEKADILEMTVRHVQALHRHEAAAGGRLVGGGRLVIGEEGKYRAGYTHCVREVAKYLATLSDLPQDLHNKVLSHLNAIASSVSSNVNSNATSVQNNVNVMPNPAPIILVLNTTAGAPVPQQPPLTQSITFQENGGNSLGAQPQVTLVSTPRFQQQQLQQCGLQIMPTHLNNGDLALVLPATQQVVSHSSSNTRAPPSAALQASAPVLTAILTSDRNSSISSSSFVQPPALSTSSDDSALGTETLDTSDSDISCSGISTPMSLSSAGSPVPVEETGRTSPKRAGSSRASPPPRARMWNSSIFREELGPPSSSSSSSCPNRSSTTRRQPVLAPKPTYPAWPSRSAPNDYPPRIRIEKSPPPPPAEPQSMWRPWH
ncbi:protein hairy-like [Homarus americanus]|uniref:Deadpan-like 5 n=1 Tax=Homarus americanus TaxID=6706 RepID=A0A8J5TI31_HOMAM|nr:protein hairy-like [Homarus americanus]XP_042210081.1 protein hairy-like [Homarus americanus]KAG7175649.1 deadpan-like 5 [Homarus americanus]